ncbi:MAG: DUF5615 family PIN-like protein [Nitrospirota bacterium]
MKLLFDQNLSPWFVDALRNLYPGSVHVRDVGLRDADDDAIWQYATRHGLTIASKDADFHQRSFLFGHPPKVIWIRRGNCSTADILSILRARHTEVEAFGLDAEGAFLALE